jgi:hypothetical protein
MNNNVQDSHRTQTQKQRHQESTVITKCLARECTGFYTDSITETVLIKCLDPKHIGEEGCSGPQPQATHQNPSTADVTPSNRMTKGGNYNVK